MPYKDQAKAKEASKASAARWSKKYPEKANAKAREWRRNNIKYFLHWNAKKRAKKLGLEFSIKLEDIPAIPDICPIAGIPIHPRNTEGKGPCENSPTLDRIDTGKGYVPGNIRPLSFKGNRMKSDLTLKDLETIRQYISNEI